MKIAIIGNGNAGTAFYEGLLEAGFMVQIFARSPKKSIEKNLHQVFSFSPDLCMLAVSDQAITSVSESLAGLDINTIMIHISGATPMKALDNEVHILNAVIYPLQTLRKGKKTDWKNTPLFVQSSDQNVREKVWDIASRLSAIVYDSNDEARLTVHLSAVMTNNFVNHLTTIAYNMLQKQGIDESVLFPILKTTLEKLTSKPPELTQTGPAVRGDKITMQRHRKLISDNTLLRMYDAISESIIKYHGK
jgi:predicted short-subunit dehydrogenase-like oxidoreductase (DUF2520 family)